MTIFPWSILSAAVVGDDLHTALVSGSLLGVRWRAGPVLRSFRGMAPEEARRALGPLARGSRLMLVLPSSMVGCRATGVPSSRWLSAREEVLSGIQSLFPMSPEDACVGFVGRRGASGEDSGYILAADRKVVDAWTEALSRATGSSVDVVLSSHQALLGLGVQGESETHIADHALPGEPVHRLVYGEVAELSAAPASESLVAAARALPGAEGEVGSRAMSGAELAASAALALRTAPGLIGPLRGASPGSALRWVPAIAAVAAACVIPWLASATREWRYERAAAALEREAEASRPRFETIMRQRARIESFAAALGAVRGAGSGGGVSMLGMVDAVQRSVPGDAFIYRVDLDSGSMAVRGEAKRAGEVLRAIEESEEFQGAREQDAPVIAEERGLEMFHIRAERSDRAGRAGGGER